MRIREGSKKMHKGHCPSGDPLCSSLSKRIEKNLSEYNPGTTLWVVGDHITNYSHSLRPETFSHSETGVLLSPIHWSKEMFL